MEIAYLGNYKGQNQGLRGSVYSGGGCCPTIRTTDYKDPIAILIKVGNGTREPNRNDKEVWEQERMLRPF